MLDEGGGGIELTEWKDGLAFILKKGREQFPDSVQGPQIQICHRQPRIG
jgi:hypothetical protein